MTTPDPDDPRPPAESPEQDDDERERRALRRLTRAFVSANSYGLLLLAIIATYGLSVGLPQGRAKSLIVIAQLITVWLALRVSRAHIGLRRLTEVLATLAVIGAIVHGFDTSRNGPGWVFLAAGLLYLITPFAIVKHIALRRDVDQETLLGALCSYLLIGMAFAFFYQFLTRVQSGAFFEGVEGTLSDDFFFSFITLTTTGYGNLVPARNPGQSLAVMEALIGQLFLITAVGKIVTAWRPKAWDATREPGDDPPAGN